MKNKNILINNMLLLNDILDTDYEYCYEPIVVGIATKHSDTKRQYFVYNTNERGYIDWIEEKDTFNEALLFARKMYRGMFKTYSNYLKLDIDNNKEIEKQIHEELTQELFRQFLIKANIAQDYIIINDDTFKFKEDEYSPFYGTVNVYKDNNVWIVWEDVEYEVFMGYYKGRHTNIKKFASQEEAYKDAVKRRGFNITTKDITYDEKDTQGIINIIESAKSFLKFVIDFNELENVNKLIQRYILLETFEEEIIRKNNSDDTELVKKTKIDKYVDYQISKSYEQAEIERLKRLKGLLLKKQFLDAPNELTKIEYNKWLKEAKKTYLLSIPTQSLLMGDIHHYPKHSKEELNESVIGNLSAIQIIQILDSLDLYTIMKLITDDVMLIHDITDYWIRKHGDVELIGNTEEGKLVAYPFHQFNRSFSLGNRNSYVNRRDGVKSINSKNAYELLYSYLRLPISTVLSSINEVNTHISCDIPFNNELCSKIEKIQKEASVPQYLIRTRK